MGAGLRDWTERGTKNVGRVFEHARKKLGDRIETPAAVPPKVLKGILGEAPFCDDELSAEYFGGVLASSRTDIGRDDRGATFVALLGRLSTYQIRTHFIFYSLFRTVYEGLSENVGVQQGRARLLTFIPIQAYASAMEMSDAEVKADILSHAMFGLVRETLIDHSFLFGDREHVHSRYHSADSGGLVVAPSALGVELYLWALGRGDVGFDGFLNPSVELTCETKIITSPGTRSVIFQDRGYPKPEPAAEASELPHGLP